jgi:thiamine pyrophosphokinase
MKHALIVGGGPVDLNQLSLELANHPDLIIAADSGGKYLLELGVLPEVLVGDNDSIPEETRVQLIAGGIEVRDFPPEKDQTDLELALDLVLSRGAKYITIVGGLGRRIDHTLGNIGLLVKALEAGAEAHLLDPGHDITVVNHRAFFRKKPGWAVSLIPLTPKVSGVTTHGLVYGLHNEELFFYHSRGIHNQFSDQAASVELTHGILLIVCFQEST